MRACIVVTIVTAIIVLIIIFLNSLSHEDLLTLFYYSVIGLLVMLSHCKQNEKKWNERYSDLKDKYDELYKEYRKLQDEKLKSELLKKSDKNAECTPEDETKKCDVCKKEQKEEDVRYFATSGYKDNSDFKIFLSGGVNICNNCLKECEKCEICGKLIPTNKIRKYINLKMTHPIFCSEYVKHKRIQSLDKNKKS